MKLPDTADTTVTLGGITVAITLTRTPADDTPTSVAFQLALAPGEAERIAELILAEQQPTDHRNGFPEPLRQSHPQPWGPTHSGLLKQSHPQPWGTDHPEDLS